MNLYHPVIRVPERRQPDMIPRQPGAASDPARNAATNAGSPEKAKPFRVAKKIGPNDPCPCGSGKNTKMLRENRRLITEARVSPKLDRNPRSRFKLF